jgi:hypothetical protein
MFLRNVGLSLNYTVLNPEDRIVKNRDCIELRIMIIIDPDQTMLMQVMMVPETSVILNQSLRLIAPRRFY